MFNREKICTLNFFLSNLILNKLFITQNKLFIITIETIFLKYLILNGQVPKRKLQIKNNIRTGRKKDSFSE